MGATTAKKSLHLPADSSFDLHLGAYGKDWLWEQSVEKSCFGGGGSKKGPGCHCQKSMKPHLGLGPLKNKSFRLCAPSAGEGWGRGSVPGQGTEISHVAWCDQTNNDKIKLRAEQEH